MRLNGHVGTEGTYAFTYGFAAARIRTQSARGQHSAFWMQAKGGQSAGGAKEGGAEIDGEPTEEDLATYRGRPVAKVPLWLDPQARVEVTWQMTGPVEGADELELRTTPGVKTGGEVVRTTLACG